MDLPTVKIHLLLEAIITILMADMLIYPSIALSSEAEILQNQQRLAAPSDPSVLASGIAIETNEPTCPKDDGVEYLAPDGAFFYIQCNHESWTGSTKIKQIIAKSLPDCINECNADPSCQRVNYGGTDSICILGTTAAISDTPSKNYHFAYLIDPPTDDYASMPFLVPEIAECPPIKCPKANSTTYNSKSGERFRIECGVRHGSTILLQSFTPSLKECMDKCGKLITCRSVDYYPKTTACFFMGHTGEAIIEAVGFVSAYAIGCSSAYLGACGT